MRLSDHSSSESEPEQTFSLVYEELRLIAHRQLNRRRTSDTLDTTALVHEAYMRLSRRTPESWNDDRHFYATAAQAMRQIMVDYARKTRAEKRGGEAHKVTLNESNQPTLIVDSQELEILDLEKALTELGELNPRLAKVVELRFYAGLSIEETANVLSVTTRTIDRDWFKAKAFLYRFIHGSSSS